MFFTEKIENNCITLCLDRPEVHNAFNDEMILELTEYFNSISSKENIRLVTIEGNGPSFCAGADLNWMKKMKDYSEADNEADSVRLAHLFQAINSCPHPVLAKVHGAALGGGVGIISCCDYVMISHTTKLGFSETRLGLVPAVISPFVIRKIGESHARAYFLSGNRFSADEALQMNLVHKVVDQDELAEQFEKIKKQFLKAAPHASKVAKSLIEGVLKRKDSEKDLQSFTCKTIASIRIGEEAQEGMQALLEKRKPNWIES